MFGDKDGYLALGIAFGFMVALALFIWVNGFANLGYCAEGENYGACIRNWFGALSGWVAAAAAALAIGPLLGQLREQRRQTGFTLGDAEPTIDIERRAHLSLRIRIVNWNRRMLSLRPIRIEASECELFPNSILRKTDTLGNEHVLDVTGFKVLGWEDRNRRPPYYEMALEIADPADPAISREPLTVTIEGELIGKGGGAFKHTTVVRRWGTLLE